MARIKGALATRKRRKKVLKLAKGYWGAKSKHFKMAKQAVMKSGNYAYIGRKQRKRDFRRLWIDVYKRQVYWMLRWNNMKFRTLWIRPVSYTHLNEESAKGTKPNGCFTSVNGVCIKRNCIRRLLDRGCFN